MDKTSKDQTLAELQHIYKYMPVGLCYFDTDFRFIHINDWLAQINGMPAKEHIGRTIGELIPDVAAGVEAQLRQVIDSGEPIIGGAVEAETPAQPGLIRHFQHSYYPVRSDDGAVIGVSCVVEDVTVRNETLAALRQAHDELEQRVQERTAELQKANESLIQEIAQRVLAEEDRLRALEDAKKASRAKSEFLAAMSHELRTPLNAILGFSDVLCRQLLGPLGVKKYLEYAKDIHASGEHLLSLVNDLLDISAIESGKRSLTKEKLDMEELVTESMNIVAENARDKGIELVKMSPENLPILYADKRAIRQILLNLLSNALKFTPEGGKIMVSVKASKNKATFTITDTGTGIPAERLSNLTSPFLRQHRDPHKTVQGWGLGLAITKSLVDLHDGDLDIKSKVDEGTTVSVMVPNHAQRFE